MPAARLDPPGRPMVELVRAGRHPFPASTACLVFDTSPDGAGLSLPGVLPHPVRYLRLFALDECVLGRYEPDAAQADLLLTHHADGGPVADGLTRRISARHAVVRRGREGFEIEDVSRFGILVDGVWPGKHAPVALRPGMRIALTASIPGVAVLEVGALLPNGILLRRIDAGMAEEAFCLLDPEYDPGDPDGSSDRADWGGCSDRADCTDRHASGLPLLFHRNGGFWLRDACAGATPLTPTSATERLTGWPPGMRFTAIARPERPRATARTAAGALGARFR